MPRLLRGVFPLVVALYAGACSSHLGPERSALDRNRELWAATGPATYVYAVERVCFCAMRGPARVTVENGRVVSVVLVEREEGAQLPEPTPDLFPSVDGLFDIIEDALERDAHSIEVRYDPVNGVPREIFIDYLENAVDEELGMHVTEPVRALDQRTAVLPLRNRSTLTLDVIATSPRPAAASSAASSACQ